MAERTELRPNFRPDPAQLRLAGLLYLVIIVCGVGGDGLVRSSIITADAAQTTANLVAAELSFRLSIMADVLMVLADVGLGVLLFALLAPLDRTLSMMAMAFRLAQAAVLGANLVHLERAASLATTLQLPAETREALVQSSLEAHAAGYDLGLFLFGINCLLVAALLRRARVFPRWLGIGVLASGSVYLVGSTLTVVAPDLGEGFTVAYLLPLVAELAVCIWLLAARVGRTSRTVMN